MWGVWLSGLRRFIRQGQIIGLGLGDCSRDWVAVWVSVLSLGFGGRFRCPRRWRCSEDLFSKAMRSCKDFDSELCMGAGLFDAGFMLREVIPTWGNIKTVRSVVVSSCSTTRGHRQNVEISCGLVSSWYKVVFVMSIWTGGSIAILELGLLPPGVGVLSLDGGSESDVWTVGAQ